MVERLAKVPRRKRLLTITISIGLLCLIAMSFIVWIATRPSEVYRPGEEIEGLTADLARSLPPDYPRVQFTDVTAESGIQFQHFWGRRSIQLPEDMGSGAAWGDYDNDGWEDLFVVNQVGPLSLDEDSVAMSPASCVLYRNNGDGTFADVTSQVGLEVRAWGMAAAWADYDNDGWLDLFVSAYGENQLFKNERGKFRSVTSVSGIGGRPGFWAGVGWADYDLDGFLDLYVCGYVKYQIMDANLVTLQYEAEVPASINPSSFEAERNLLFHNNGDGTFTEVAAHSGVLGENGRSLSAAWCDFDDDGWPDLYVANDVSDNVLYRNLGNSQFEDISHAAWVADYRGAMGIATGDWDNDNDVDMFVTHWIAQENALYSNLTAQIAGIATNGASASLKFMDEADRYGLGQIALDYIGWGTSFIDYDNDCKLDLFVVNGSTFQISGEPWLLVPMPGLLFWNRGRHEGFYDVSKVSGRFFHEKYVGRGAAFCDYDKDGDIDVFVVNNVGPAILLRNDGGNQKNWLQVKLVGTTGNRQGIGAKVRLFSAAGQQVRQVGSQSSYCSQNSLVQHFGLGSDATVDTLEVTWPGGIVDVRSGLAANQMSIIEEGRR
jgi:hypothetical protein